MFRPIETPILTLRGPWGVPVEIAPSFLLLMFVLMGFRFEADGLIFVVLVGLSILLHEWGHAWGALVQGEPVRRVVLWGGGGFCEYRRAATARKRELMVAMGPLVNLTLWAAASLAAEWMSASVWGSDAWFGMAYHLHVFGWINLTLFALNMLPVQPLDGGQLLQLALLRVVSPRAAMRVAGVVGLVVAVLWVPAMIFVFITWGWVLFFIPSIRRHLEMAKGRPVF
ncbi:site-2 protease family protein [Jannaschia rubra]|uniref:site-2 protease family protein n=1 Tax=Jannaschia rubra TaxID=282197 RepID=UPI0024927C8A|nr:site-2 protease family protein [Jannaschia rubra]